MKMFTRWIFEHPHQNGLQTAVPSLTLHLFVSSFVLVVVMAKFANNGSNVLLHLSPSPQSDNFIPCHFNPLCFCKYDQRTEIYDVLSSLWQVVRFNSTEYSAAVSAIIQGMRQGPGTLYYVTEAHLLAFTRAVANSTTALRVSLFEYGPIFDIECANVPIAAIPTDYKARGVISHVSVTGGKLSMLDGSAFAGLEIQGIRLPRNHLFFISEYAFRSMSNSLTMLDVSMNELDEIPFNAFASLKVLEWLNLSNNQLNSIAGDWLTISFTLRKLLLGANSLDSIPRQLFGSFPRLSWLGLNSNFIHNITSGGLPPNLQTLDLSRNRFSHFPSEVFHLRSLSWLLLGECEIDGIPHDWPNGAGPLQMNQLDLTENFIQIWPAKPFGAQLTLFDLSVSKNYLQTLPSAAFESMNIFRLSLGYNRIHMIEPGAFDSLETTLKYLNLENNRLLAIPWAAVSKLTALMHLYLGSNLIQDEGMGSPEGTECKLTYLGLNGNQLTRFPKRTLIHCSRLSHLNLGYNQIRTLDDLTHLHQRGKRLRSLNTLILRNNPIRTLAVSQTSPIFIEELENSPQVKNESAVGNPSGQMLKTKATIFISELKQSQGTKNTGANVFRTEVFRNLKELSLSFCQIVGEIVPFPPLSLTTLEISMGLNTATNLSPFVFQSLRHLEWLALDHNAIHTISDFAFYANHKLNYVNLEWNRISSLPQLFHPDIHESITHLRLAHNVISSVTKNSFVSFPAINLDLSYNVISRIEPHAFTEVSPAATTAPTSDSSKPDALGNNSEDPSFKSSHSPEDPVNPFLESGRPGLNLYLAHNRLSSLKNFSLAGNKFSVVDLSYNRLRSLNFGAFGRRTVVGGLNVSHNEVERIVGLRKSPSVKGQTIYVLLKFLDLSYNRISNAGIDLRTLCVTDLIDLSNNRIEQLHADIFPYNCSVKELNLRSNTIRSLDPGTFSNLPDLTVLHLSWNQILSFSPITFIRNTKLKYLDLSHNRLRTLPRDSLIGSSLETLDLSWNQFVTIPIGALSQISRRLKRLDMSHNSVEHLDSTMFESIPGLLYLNLSSNRLSTLPDSAFANLASLRELDLSKNALRTNFKELFHFLPKLKVLRLSGCGIKVLPFLPLPHLVSLDLSRNGLAEMKMQNLGSLPRLRHLDLSSNELSGPGLPSWTPLYNLVTLKLSANPLKSMTRDTFHGLGKLEALEIMDMGRVDRFDSDVFSHFGNLRSLAVETYQNIEKYRFRLGGVLSSLPHLEELRVKIKESILSDQLIGGILPKLRKLTITGSALRKIEPNALEGLENCFNVDLRITGTSIEEVPPKVFELLQSAAWVRLDLSFNKISSLDYAYLYPNKTVWFSRGTKTFEGGLILDGNEFICHCDLVWIGEWLRRWLRESFQSHSTDNIPLVNSMYESIKRPTCKDSNGRVIPLIDLYADVMCHASALSEASTSRLPRNPQILWATFAWIVIVQHFISVMLRMT